MRINIKVIISLALAITVNANAESFTNWKAYMAYGNITDIEPAGKIVYVLSSNSLFSYNYNDGEIQTYSKVFPLSDCIISNIAWNNNVKKLAVIYDNGNIDLLDNNNKIENIAGYKNKTMTVDKTINNVVIVGKMAYLCTAFGLVQIDMEEALIRETFNIAKNVTNCAVKGNYIYIKTADAQYKGNNNENLLNPANWKLTTENIDFSHENDIKTATEDGYTRYYTYDKTNKCYWANQKDQKLQAYTIGADKDTTIIKQDILPDAPLYNTFGFMTVANNKLYACNGGVWDQHLPAAIQVYNPNDNEWTFYDNEERAKTFGVPYTDIMCLAVDPRDDSHVMAGTQYGIYEFKDGIMTKVYDQENSLISPYIGLGKNYQLITSMFYDNNSNLWIANSYAQNKRLIVYTADNKWTAPEKQFEAAQAINPKIMMDKSGRIWIASGRYSANGVFCYSADLNNLYSYTNFFNEDGKSFGTMEFLRQAVEDKDGNIWVATSNSLLTLPPEYQANPSLGFYQIKVPRNDGTNYADYLLDGADVTTIAVDNANRKWIGTKNNGVYVISPDNMVQEAHFKADETVLLSDNIEYITINDKTGRVYIGTNKGLCSVESNASETFDNMDKDNVWAYPNPVKPDYTGLVNIVGLSFNADVKITTTNGVLVAQGRSTGGTFQWDCRDLKGKRVASGIYMVNTATESGESGTVCKIAIVN